MLCRHSVQDECRILLLHGLLHLVGHDHELGPHEEANMARQEQQIMQNLGWKVSCMIGNSVLAYYEPVVANCAKTILATTADSLHGYIFL